MDLKLFGIFFYLFERCWGIFGIFVFDFGNFGGFFFEIFREFSQRIFWGEFFVRFSVEKFFGRIFLGGIFWVDFFLRDFFWKDFLGGMLWEDSLFILELTCLSRFWVNGEGRKENFRSLEVRGKLIALKKAKLPKHLQQSVGLFPFWKSLVYVIQLLKTNVTRDTLTSQRSSK